MIKKLREAWTLEVFNFRLLKSAIARPLCAGIEKLYARYVGATDAALIEKLQAERDDLAESLSRLRESWASTVKANAELGTAHVEALCEIGELRSIIWHFALRANLAVADAMKQLNEPQQQKVQAIWRDSADAYKRAGVPA